MEDDYFWLSENFYNYVFVQLKQKTFAKITISVIIIENFNIKNLKKKKFDLDWN
jgi:hypothetical protein